MLQPTLFDGLEDKFLIALEPNPTPDAGLIAKAPGLSYIPDFISRDEETGLIHYADQGNWSNQWQRRTQYFGNRYIPGEANEGEARAELPEWSAAICERLVYQGIFPTFPNQIGINEYLPGQGISPHIDHESGTVVSLSLGSGCVMDFRECDGPGRASIWLARRSIVVMTGEARHNWTHGIARRQTDRVDDKLFRRERRISITFRGLETA